MVINLMYDVKIIHNNLKVSSPLPGESLGRLMSASTLSIPNRYHREVNNVISGPLNPSH